MSAVWTLPQEVTIEQSTNVVEEVIQQLQDLINQGQVELPLYNPWEHYSKEDFFTD